MQVFLNKKYITCIYEFKKNNNVAMNILNDNEINMC
jgi:hypothetical protein